MLSPLVSAKCPLCADRAARPLQDKWPVLILEQPLLAQIGKKYGKSPAQVAFRWALQKNITINPRTYKPDHMKVRQRLGRKAVAHHLERQWPIIWKGSGPSSAMHGR